MSCKIAEEHDMIGTDRLAPKCKSCLMGRLIPFAVVTPNAGTHKVFPRFIAATGFRDDMVHRQRYIGPAAVLASVAIAAQNILSREDDAFEGNTDVERKPNDAGKRHRGRNRMEQVPVSRCDQFSFSEIKKDDCFLDVTDTEWLVIVVEDEHFTV